MKTVILIRHAKSDWPENTEDFDRPLAAGGVAQATNMAQRLHGSNINIDKMFCSPALRAKHTCDIFNETFILPVEAADELYNPKELHFENLIDSLDETLSTVAIFSHNNGISNFANTLTDDIYIFPTCGVAAFESPCSSWQEFRHAAKKLLFFYEPDKL